MAWALTTPDPDTVRVQESLRATLVPQPAPPQAPTTLQEAVHQLDPTEKWAVSQWRCVDNGASMAQALQSHTAIGVSDGSQGDLHSTSGFILTRRTKWKKECKFANASGTNVVPGIPEEQDSYRAELGGLMGLMVMAKVICQVHAVTQGSLEVGLDGESAYKAVFETEQVEVNAKAADLIRAIKESITQLPLQVTGRHIEGHQDDKVAFSQLDRWAQLNVNMDTAAKALLAQIRQGPPQTNIPMPHERIRVYHKGVKQSRVCKKELYQEIYGDITKQKWAQLHNIPQSLIDDGIN